MDGYKYMMKKAFFAVTSILILLAPHASLAAKPNAEIKIIIDNKELKMDVNPVIENGRTLVPFRPLFEALGLNVKWDGKNKGIYADTKTKNGSFIKYISLIVGEKDAVISNYGKSSVLDVPPVIKDGRTMVPLRFVSEALDMDVKWDEVNKLISVNSKEFSLDKEGFIVKRNESIILKSDKEFIEIKDYADYSKYFLALGEDHKLYIVAKSDLKYRQISKEENNIIDLFYITYYNGRFYYVDKLDNISTIVKKTDGEKETYFSTISCGSTVAIKNRLYFTDGYSFKCISGIKYIDMDNDQEFTITTTEHSQVMYASDDAIFYYTYSEKGQDQYEFDFHLRTPNKDNNDDDKVIHTITTNHIGLNYYFGDNGYNGSIYLRPDMIKSENEFYFYDLENGIYRFNPIEKEFTKISDIKPLSLYYTNKKLYMVKDGGIGYLDLSNNKYIKLFSKADMLTYHITLNSIIEVDKSGNVTFYSNEDIGMQHFNVYKCKYLIEKNKILIISFTPGRSDQPDRSKELEGKLIDVDK